MAETTSEATGKDSDESAKYFDFPKFVEEGSEFKVEKPEGYKVLDSVIMYRDIKPGEGDGIKEKQKVMYRDIKLGEGDGIKEKQKVSLHYNYYNQSAYLIESMNFEGSLDQLTNKFGPGLKEGIKDMKLHGKRRIILLPSKTDTQGKKPRESSDEPAVSDAELKNADTQEKNARESSDNVAVSDAGSKKRDTQGKKAGASSTDKLGVSKDILAGKAVGSGLKSARTHVEKGEVSKVELPVVFDVELLGILRTWNPFG